MKVVHVIGTLRGGGAESLVRLLLPRLRRRGVDARVVSTYESRLDETQLEALDVPVYELDKHPGPDLSFLMRLAGLLRSLEPDVVHTHTIEGKYYGRVAALISRAPVIVHTEHSPHDRLLRWELPPAWLLSRFTDACITFSGRTADFVKQREPAGRLTVIPNGIPVPPEPTAEMRAAARARLRVDGDTVVFGVVASMYPHKNHRLALDAFAHMPAEARARARLDMFGDGPLFDELATHARDLGIAPRVRFHGFRDDVPALLPGLDIFLSVSRVEAAPISFLEAMAAGVPIVSTPNIGALDLIEDGRTGWVTDCWSPIIVAAAMRDAVRDAEWRARAGRAAYARVRGRYDIDEITAQHIALYERLLQRKRREIAAPTQAAPT